MRLDSSESAPMSIAPDLACLRCIGSARLLQYCVDNKFVHVYMDDIFIFSCSIEEHDRHLGIVFERLRKNYLFLSKKTVDLYSERMESLGHIIGN
jgi:tmRNA-binding protein